MSMDINKVATLLHILEKASQSPALGYVRNLALVELVEINEDARKELEERAKKEAEEAAAAKAKADEEAKARADKEISYEPPPPQGETPAGNGEMTRRSF
jgi:hypothetical protein